MKKGRLIREGWPQPRPIPPGLRGLGPRVPVLLEIGFMNLVQSILLAARQHREFRSALAALDSYSDRELGELGLSRSDIVRVAYAEAERCMAPHAMPDRAPAWQQPALVAGL